MSKAELFNAINNLYFDVLLAIQRLSAALRGR